MEFIRRHKERPFFLYLALTAPHLFIEAPDEDVAEYKGKFPERDLAVPVYATYAAMIARLDKEVGRILATLDAEGIADETLVVFTSDHGATFETRTVSAPAFHDSNRPFRGQKRTLWEGGIRVPAIVRWPGRVPSGNVSSEIVHMIDVMPTFLAAAGGRPDPVWKVGGWNMLSVWTGAEKAPARTMFWEWRSEGYYHLAAMRGDLKVVVTGDNPPELFNVETDPAERRTIAGEHRDLVKALVSDLDGWLATETAPSKEGREREQQPTR